MDLQYSTESFGTRDWSWIANKAGVAEQTQSLTVLVAGMTKSKHYPEGFVKPGILLAQYSSGGNSGLWAPWVEDHVGGLGLNTIGAIVLDGGRVRTDSDGDNIAVRVTCSAILQGWPLHVFVAKLPNLLLTDGTTNNVVSAANLSGTSFVAVDGI